MTTGAVVQMEAFGAKAGCAHLSSEMSVQARPAPALPT